MARQTEVNLVLAGHTPNRQTHKMSEVGKLLEGAGADIAQGRMPPLTIVPNLNVLKDGLASQGSRLESVIRTFALQGCPEALFFHGVVLTASNSTHTDLDLSFF